MIMASGEELARQIGALAEELGRELAGAQRRVEALTAAVEEARTAAADQLAARQAELETAEKRIETLVQKLKEARQEASDTREAVRQELQQRMAELEQAADDARAELDRERSIRKRLEKGAAADEKRLNELEKALAEAADAAVAAPDRKTEAEVARLQAELDDACATIVREQREKAELEEQLGAAHKLIEALELAVKRARERTASTEKGDDGARVRELTERLAAAEARLEAERREARQSARAQADAEKRVAVLEQALSEAGGHLSRSGESAAASARSSPEKLLPHELRPAPKPGALFRPDWDLAGVPCKSADQVLQLWGSVFNVQLSLEGYPSQYCTAFLVVLKQGRQKHLYMVFNLKSSRHVLVCVPSKPPADEASLNMLIAEGQKYLQMSGFELEKIKPADVGRVLESYFVGAGQG